jgi:hypothetical protein
MNQFPRPLRKEKYEFFILQPADDVVLDIKREFEKKNWWGTPTIPGEFIAPYSFTISTRWKFFSSTREFDTITIHGTISYHQNSGTTVSIIVEPRLGYLISLLIFPIIGIALFTKGTFNFDGNHLFPSICFISIAPLMALYSGYYQRKRIKDTFIKLFKVEPIEKA